MIVVVVVVVELYADIHNSSPFHTHTLLRAHALECEAEMQKCSSEAEEY